MKRAAAQITVFLALSSVLIFALFCTCLEGGRAACTDYLMKQAAQSSLRSVFAAYQGDVKREYGLLLCQGREQGLLSWTKEAERYAEKYLEPGAGSLLDAADRIRARSVYAAALDSVYITEGQGRIFADAVTDYMSSAGLSILIQEFLKKLGLYSEEEGLSFLSGLKDMLTDRDSTLEGILDSYSDLKGEAEKLQALAAEGGGEGEEAGPPPPSGQETPGGSGPAAPTEVKADLLEQIKAIKENGLIAVITGTETLSTYSWTDASLPSALPQYLKNRHSGYPSASVSLLRHFLMGEFLQRRMGDYTDRKTGGAQYEIEYVLTGKSSDKAAFETVVGELLLIRMGFNLAYLCTDAEKQLMAETLAAAILTVLALPQLTLVLKWLLIAAWALAESIVDVKVLLKGRKLPLLKNSASWQLNALSLDLSAGNGTQTGLAYEDYLRLLFLLGSSEAQSYRMMDVMQKRIGLKQAGFLMNDYMVCASVSLTATTAYLYIQQPLLGPSRAGKGRQYTSQATFAYERR